MKLFLHIGLPKTGTTSIQAFLQKNAEKLKEQGILLPSVGWKTSMSAQMFLARLFVHSDDSPDVRELARTWPPLDWLEDDVRNYKERFLKAIERTPAASRKTVIVSSEVFSYLSKSGIASLKAWLSDCFNDISIVVYLRRQPEWLASCDNQFRKFYDHGTTSREYHVTHRFYRSLANYDTFLANWASAFGADALKVRLFDRDAMIGEDVVADFTQVVGFETCGLERAAKQNESLDETQIDYLRRMDDALTAFPENVDRWYWYEMFFTMSRQPCPRSVGRILAREQAGEILERYRDSNKAVARKYFQRESLFDEDVSSYPEEIHPKKLTVEQCIEYSARLWIELYAKYYDLRLADDIGSAVRSMRENAGKSGFADEDRKLALFGAGRWGLKTLSILRKMNCRVDYFLDNAQDKNGTSIEGVPVVSLDFLAGMSENIDILITHMDTRKTHKQLEELGMSDRVRGMYVCDYDPTFQSPIYSFRHF